MRKRQNAARIGRPRGVRSLRERGFVIIITLVLMMMLLVLVVGLLSLSIITLRSGDQASYAARARANARMSLMLAIGELQMQAGSDTRVTARADILDANNGPVLGVWKSWEGTDHTTSGSNQGRPIPPVYNQKSKRFLNWLVSRDPSTPADSSSVPPTTSTSNSVTLVGENTVGSGQDRDKLQVHLDPILIDQPSGKGGYAWWIGGENEKARLPKPYKPDDNTSGRWAEVAKSHTVADTKPFRMEQLLTDASPADRAISLQMSDFVGTKDALPVSKEFFHDLSTTSVGLLTNTATGGWRKDLSTLTENWNTVPSTNLPLFRATPTVDVPFNKPTSANPCPTRGMLYPWAAYRGGPGDMAIYRQGAVASWENLKDYMLMYRNAGMSTSSTGRCRVNAVSTAIDGDAYNFIHRVRILPVIARIQWVFSYSAVAASGGNGAIEPRLIMNPVITMWNPYNVELNLPATGSGQPALSFSIPKPLPPAINCTISGTSGGGYKPLMAGSTNYTTSYSTVSAVTYNITSIAAMKPGETRVFSAQSNAAVPMTSPLTLGPGYRQFGGHYMGMLPAQANGQPGTAPSGSTLSIDAKFDTAYNDIQVGVGIYLDMSVSDTVRHLAYRMVYTPQVANQVYLPLSGMVKQVPLASAMAQPVPFLSMIFGARMASTTIAPSKGFVQSSPLVNYTAMGFKDLAETTIARHYLGTRNPVNSPFDYSFLEHSDGGDSKLPNVSGTSGFIVSGFQKADGLSRCPIAELPTRPLQSLGELQNWDLRYENPIPPYAFNLIGNSDATPLVPAGVVVDSSNQSLSVNLQYDDSYCANHVLFDDWFLSSIAPDPDTYGTVGRSIQQTFTDFISGTKPLPNRAYLPIAEDAGGNGTDIYNNHVKTADGWKTIASRLEVEGMFNVNSTSVTAWRALLGHARNQSVPYYQDAGTSWSVGLSQNTDHANSRFSVAGDVQCGASGSAGAFPGASEFSGYRVLTDSMIDQLATEVVKQVRLRGPFLSLSEFVNRQLVSSGGNLALAGTIQAALNQMAQGSSNPYSALQSLSTTSVAAPTDAFDAEYKFPDAAVGKSSYGLPGWTRQADILRPLAPILSARDDTFTIRAHGDARDTQGNIVSRAVCEAVVRRTRDYVDPKDAADLATYPTSAVNQTFGRHFEIVSFRWLETSEI